MDNPFTTKNPFTSSFSFLKQMRRSRKAYSRPTLPSEMRNSIKHIHLMNKFHHKFEHIDYDLIFQIAKNQMILEVNVGPSASAFGPMGSPLKQSLVKRSIVFGPGKQTGNTQFHPNQNTSLVSKTANWQDSGYGH